MSFLIKCTKCDKYLDNDIDKEYMYGHYLVSVSHEKSNCNILSDLDLHELEDQRKINFGLKKDDIIVDIPQTFVLRFKRGNIHMASMKFIDGTIKIFREDIMDLE